MAEKEQQSSSSQEQGPSTYDEDRKALLVLAFMPRPEIEAFWLIKVLSRRLSTRLTPGFMEKLDTLKLYMVGKQIAFEDLTQRFPAMNNTFSKSDTQQKMTYAQVVNTTMECLQHFNHVPSHNHRAQIQELMTRTHVSTSYGRRSANEQKGPCLSRRAAQVAHGPVDIEVVLLKILFSGYPRDISRVEIAVFTFKIADDDNLYVFN
ncbi:MAG: hypothetical protein EZS28_043850, partial [Streblomastix strix]